jgi:helicase
MLKERYLESALLRINEITNDHSFKNQLYQLRASSIQEEFGDKTAPSIQFTFDPDQIWRLCNFVFSETVLLLDEGYGIQKHLISNLREIGEAFEFLAKISNDDDKEILLINSALCYQLAGYQANALCITRRVESEFPIEENLTQISNSSEQVFASLFRIGLINFLKHDINDLQKRTSTAIERINNLQEVVTSGIANSGNGLEDIMNLTGHAFFQKALSDFVQYCINGREEDFNLVLKHVRKSSTYFKKIRDVRFGNITSELISLILLFRTRSTWQVISRISPQLTANAIWRTYLRNLALEKSIVEFWPSQLMAIKNGLINSNESYVVQMPTSAGKTFVAELAILAALTKHDSAQCLYIAPFRALVNEVEEKLADNLGAVGYRVSTLIGGFEFDAFQEYLLTNSDVLVTTPEKAELLFRTKPEFFDNLALVVIDEGHIVDEGIPEKDDEKTLAEYFDKYGTLGRGVLLEVLTTRLKLKYPSAQFIFLSAVMPEINAHDFIGWLSDNEYSIPLRISPHDRPSRQVLAKFEWKNQKGELEYVSLEPLPDGRHPFVSNFISRRKYLTGMLTPKRQQAQQKTWPESIDNKVQTTAILAVKFAYSGPTLVFCAQRNHTYDIIDNLITTIQYFKTSDLDIHATLKFTQDPDLESYELAKNWLGNEHTLTKGLKYGIGLHIGPLPDVLRQAIEDDFKSGKLRILVSTNTLGQGVNLPIKTVIIYSLERAWPRYDNITGEIIGRNEIPIKRRDFWNICGRAGRAGKETEGQVVFVKIGKRNDELFDDYKDSENLEEVQSSLYQLLVALIEKRITDTELLGYLDSYAFALLAEEIIDSDDESEIEQFLQISLVGVQAVRLQMNLQPLVQTFSTVSRWIRSRVQDKARLSTYASTGLRLESCENLENSVRSFVESTQGQQILQTMDDDIFECASQFVDYVIFACGNIYEMIPSRPDEHRKYEEPHDRLNFLKSWIKGINVSELRSNLWNGHKAEDFTLYLSDQTTYKLPWGINGLLRILAFVLNREYEELPQAWQHLPAMMKFGVNDVVSCWASSIGVSSRSFAEEISKVYMEYEGFLDFNTFVLWLTELPSEFVIRDIKGTKYEKNRFFQARKRIIANRDVMNHIQQQSAQMIAEIRGIQYENRQLVASTVSVGDLIQLELEIDNLYDPYAIKVLYQGHDIGYVERNKARLLSQEIQLGNKVIARIHKVYHSFNNENNYSEISLIISIIRI